MLNEQEFNRYSIATFDFSKAIEFASEAQNHLNSSILYEALIFSAIVCYCRPFSANEKGRNALAISRLLIEDFGPISPDEEALHKDCVRLRNKALTHSEYEFNPTKANSATKTISSRPFSLLNRPFELGAFVRLTTKHLEICHKMRADYLRRI